MDIVAIIACRNEEAYLANCLRRLRDNGVSYAIIDNQSTDRTREILERPDVRKGLVAYESLPFDGVFNLEAQLEAKEKLAESLGADWIIHHDADEIRHSYRQGESLHDAIARLAAGGATVINFDEFLFLPIGCDYAPELKGPQPLRHYYFFEPRPHHRMNAWKTGLSLSFGDSGGHQLSGGNVSVAPETLALRHYIFRDQAHAFRKFTERVFSEREIKELGWHANRINQPVERFRFPPASMLETLGDPASHALSRAKPRKKHYWQWEETAASSHPRARPSPLRRLTTHIADGLRSLSRR